MAPSSWVPAPRECTYLFLRLIHLMTERCIGIWIYFSFWDLTVVTGPDSIHPLAHIRGGVTDHHHLGCYYWLFPDRARRRGAYGSKQARLFNTWKVGFLVSRVGRIPCLLVRWVPRVP
uniref:Uncharacterized protein n=1 Tax=Picea glauca TaxID=3330 RepID=A0A117NHQ3_PICGL|nr:hypothetical protein ABT39_MTgene4728 [Picea glauca]